MSGFGAAPTTPGEGVAPSGPARPAGGTAPAAPAAPAPRRPRPWRVTVRGVRTVFRWELRRGFRQAAWGVRVAVWAGLVALLVAAVAGAPGTQRGSALGIALVAVLTLSLTVTSALTAGAFGGGTSLLRAPNSAWISAADAAVGALLAAWANALLLLAATSPFLAYAAHRAGNPAQAVTSAAVIAATLLVAAAVGLAWSVRLARPLLRTALTQATLAALALGPLLLFGLAQPLATTADEVRLYSVGTDPDTGVGGACSREPELVTVPQVHTERIWWLLAPSPYVVLADAAPGRAVPGDVLGNLRDAVRGTRAGPGDVIDRCRDKLPPDAGPVWPFGLAAMLAVGAGFLVVTVRGLAVTGARGG